MRFSKSSKGGLTALAFFINLHKEEIILSFNLGDKMSS